MKTSFASDAILAVLRGRYGRVGDLVPLAEGEESQVFAVNADGRALVARINRDREGFDKDRLAAERFVGVRAPAVVSIDALEDAWVCVSERAAGTTLQALGNAAARYGDAVMATLDAIADCDVSFVTGAGPFDARGRTEFATWRQFIAEIEGPDDLVQRVRDHRYPEVRKLVHADFGSNNVLVADGAVTAVIDWSDAMAGDPLYDIANLFFWRSWLDCMEVQCRHIEQRHANRIANRDLLDRYQLRIGLQVLHEASRDGDEKLVAWALARCRAIAG